MEGAPAAGSSGGHESPMPSVSISASSPPAPTPSPCPAHPSPQKQLRLQLCKHSTHSRRARGGDKRIVMLCSGGALGGFGSPTRDRTRCSRCSERRRRRVRSSPWSGVVPAARQGWRRRGGARRRVSGGVLWRIRRMTRALRHGIFGGGCLKDPEVVDLLPSTPYDGPRRLQGRRARFLGAQPR